VGITLLLARPSSNCVWAIGIALSSSSVRAPADTPRAPKALAGRDRSKDAPDDRDLLRRHMAVVRLPPNLAVN
jgi:hypothetical protein